MKKPVRVESASRLIDEKIKELGDWRGKTLAKVREIIHVADPEIVEASVAPTCVPEVGGAYRDYLRAIASQFRVTPAGIRELKPADRNPSADGGRTALRPDGGPRPARVNSDRR